MIEVKITGETLGEIKSYMNEFFDTNLDYPHKLVTEKSELEIMEEQEQEQLANVEVDSKGIPFNAGFCGKAKEPFYSSGAREGQWKKRKGVADETYDGWYAHELSKLSNGDATSTSTVDTAGAFTDAQQPDNVVPTNCGEFMGWISELQAAGRLGQMHVTGAYAQAGLQVTDLFPPNSDDDVKQRIATLHQILTQYITQ